MGKAKPFYAKVAKFTGIRKIIEIPIDYRDEYSIGDMVLVRKCKPKA
jgi:hypothetical protein